MKKLSYLFALILTFTLVVSSCSEKADEKPVEEAQTEATHDHEGHDHDGHDHEGHDHGDAEMKDADTKEAEEVKKEEVKETKVAKNISDFTTNPLKAQVVFFNDLVKGKDGKISKAKAEKYMAKGHPLMIKAGNKVYIPYKPDGTYGGKLVAAHAGSEKEFYGKVKHVDNMNIFIIDKIK